MATPSPSEELEQKRALWKQHIESWQSSGLTQSAYCRQHELKVHQLVYWKKRFVQTDTGITFVPLKIRHSLPPSAGMCSASMRVIVDRDLQIELGADFDPRLLCRLIHHDLKSFEKAVADCETALKLDFDNAWLRTSYANNLGALGRNEEAREAARKAVEYEPGNMEAHLSLGWYAYKVGDYQESIEESKIALGLDSNIAMAAFNLGLAYAADNQLNKARTAYDQAIKLCENITEEDAKARIQAAQKDIDELLMVKPKLVSCQPSIVG